MSYSEILDTPYSLLLMLRRDKLRPDYKTDKKGKKKSGGDNKKMSGKDYLSMKRGANV